jgi:hypothetical protein
MKFIFLFGMNLSVEMKIPVVEQLGILYLPRVEAPLRLLALARREVKAGQIFFTCLPDRQA